MGARRKEATWHESQLGWICLRAVFQKPWGRGVWMLGDWQTLCPEDEKMGAGVGPLLELAGDFTAEAHTSLLKTVGSRKQNPHVNPYHFPVPKTHFEQGQPLPVSCGEMQGPEEEGNRPKVTFLPASFTVSHGLSNTTWSGAGLWDSSLPLWTPPCPSPSKAWPWCRGEGRGLGHSPAACPVAWRQAPFSQARPLLSGRQCEHTVRALCGTQAPSPLT